MSRVRPVTLAFATLATTVLLIPFGAPPAMADEPPGIEPGVPRGFEPGVPPGYEPGVPPGSCAAIEQASQSGDVTCQESANEGDPFPFGEDGRGDLGED